jgi:hypothetical protein
MLRMPRLRRPYPVLKLDLYQTSKYRIILMALNRARKPAVGARFHTKRAPDAPDGHLSADRRRLGDYDRAAIRADVFKVANATCSTLGNPYELRTKEQFAILHGSNSRFRKLIVRLGINFN